MTENCKKFREIMVSYRSGKYGKNFMSLKEILERAGEPNLFNNMNEEELRSLKDVLGNMALSFALAALKARKLGKLKEIDKHD